MTTIIATILACLGVPVVAYLWGGAEYTACQQGVDSIEYRYAAWTAIVVMLVEIGLIIAAVAS